MNRIAFKMVGGTSGLLFPPRYALEHILIPQTMYNTAGAFLYDVLTEKGKPIYNLYQEIVRAAGGYDPYVASDFKVEPRMYDIHGNTSLIVRVKMPKPVNSPDCRAVYLCQHMRTGRQFYFTSELTAKSTFFLCAWTEEDAHLNLGENDNADEFDRVAALFSELIGEDGLKRIIRTVS